MGGKKVQDPFLQIDEDLLDVPGGVDTVGDIDQGLALLEFLRVPIRLFLRPFPAPVCMPANIIGIRTKLWESRG